MEAKKYFYAGGGLLLLTDWSHGSTYEQNEARAKAAARRVYRQLIIEAGSPPRSAADFADGMPYTSSSDFAAIWLVNNQARKRGAGRVYLEGVALNDMGAPVAVYTEYNEAGEEVKTIYEYVEG